MSNTSPIGEGSKNIMEVLTNISKKVAEMNGRMGGIEERLVRVENENRRKSIRPEYDEIRRALEFNNDEIWEHGGRDGNGVQRGGVRPRDLGWDQGIGDQEYGNIGNRMGYRGDRMGYRGDRMPLKLEHYETLKAAFHDASKVEADLKEEKSYKDKSRDNWKTISSREQPKGGGQADQVKFDYKSKASEQPQGGNYVKPNFPRPSTIQCFRCQGRGHVASECPNRRTTAALRDRYKTEDEDEGEEKNKREGDRGEREKGASGDEEERLDDMVNFSCFMEKGKSLLDDDEDLNMNVNLSCVELRERIKVEEAKGEGKSFTIVTKEGSALAKNKKNICMIAKPRKCLKGVDEECFLDRYLGALECHPHYQLQKMM
ncbi:hypothetical protein H5410_005062 [Solanum commersonii]|uniref:CCHC-type domain-containing protein n=1 Tax=Solanum commersonii TaxID=4109 RepID=A0A9J6A6K2_SOLCO|nr:hypothetical protein H5410_005062 [Solanum commersonii]